MKASAVDQARLHVAAVEGVHAVGSRASAVVEESLAVHTGVALDIEVLLHADERNIQRDDVRVAGAGAAFEPEEAALGRRTVVAVGPLDDEG